MSNNYPLGAKQASKRFGEDVQGKWYPTYEGSALKFNKVIPFFDTQEEAVAKAMEGF